MLRILWTAAGLGVGAGVMWLVARSAEWSDLWQQVSTFDFRVLILALGALVFAWVLEALRWKLLLPGEQVSVTRLFLTRQTGQGLNNVSPVRVLSDLAQGVMLRYGDGVRTDRVVSSLVMARVMDLLITVTLVGGGLFVLPQLAGYRSIVLPLWILTSVGLLGFILFARHLRHTTSLARFRPINDILQTMGHMGLRRGAMAACIALSAVSWMAIGVAAWLIAQAAGVDLPYWLMAIVVVAVIMLAGATPAPPGAVGVYEFGALSTLGLFAVDPTSALTFAFVSHAVLFVPPILIGIVVLLAERQTLRHLKDAVKSGLQARKRFRLTG